jgi:adenylate cyclase
VSHCRLARENARLTIELEQKLSIIEEHKDLLLAEQRKSERLLRNILPVSVAEKLKRGERSLAAAHPEVTVLFADVVGFSGLATRLSADVLVATLNELFSTFDQLADKYGIEKIKTIGDAYMAAAGLPKARPEHVQLMARFALDMLDSVATRNAVDGGDGQGGRLALRIGIHTGPVIAGVIGEKRLIYDLWGDTVNVASRMEAHGVEGRIHVTDAVRSVLLSEFELEPRGPVEVKGRGVMNTYFLVGRLEPTMRTQPAKAPAKRP